MDWLPLLEDATDRFAREAAAGDLAAPVPPCPGWTLADLVVHLGEVHRWAAHAVVEGTPDGDETYDGAPAGLVNWYRESASRLLDVLATRGPDDPAWTFGQPRTTAFWRRRQVHETLVHTYDALAAAGREAEWDVDPALAWDGVAEVATMFYPRQVRLDRIAPLPGTLRLSATDHRAAPVDIGDTDPVVEVSGPAAYLLRLLWKRAPATDPAAAELLETAITP